MPTVKEQFEQLEHPELKELCLKNINPQWENNDAPNLYEAVLGGIDWNTATGGFDFWKYVVSMIKQEKVSEIDCTMEEPEEKKGVFGIMTGAKGMTEKQKVDRKKRNHQHFLKNVLPDRVNDDPTAKKHHLRKLGYKS